MTINNKIGLGTVQFGVDYGISNKQGLTQTKEVVEILDIAKENGIEIIDTAYAYGKSEEVLGACDLSAFKIVSKFIPPTEEKSLEFQFNSSLSKLNKESIYGYLAHRPNCVVENPKIWDMLLHYKDKGSISKIGFSFNTLEEVDNVLRKGYKPDLVQVPYNYFDKRFEEIIVELKNSGCEIHSRSTFLQGLLLMPPEELTLFFEPVFPLLNELQKLGKQLPKILLDYSKSKYFIDTVITGVNNSQQLRDNISKAGCLLPKIKDLEVLIPEQIVNPSKWPQKK